MPLAPRTSKCCHSPLPHTLGLSDWVALSVENDHRSYTTVAATAHFFQPQTLKSTSTTLSSATITPQQSTPGQPSPPATFLAKPAPDAVHPRLGTAPHAHAIPVFHLPLLPPQPYHALRRPTSTPSKMAGSNAVSHPGPLTTTPTARTLLVLLAIILSTRIVSTKLALCATMTDYHGLR